MKNLVLELSEIEKQVSALISENAQLKEKNRVLDCMLTGESLASNERMHQLDKAKDIMKRLVDLSNNSRTLLGGTWHETVREAEQFLKECE